MATATAERAQERREQARAELEAQVARLVESDEWRRFLDCRAVFHRYSFHNVLMILTQRPSATQVAGFRAWKKVNRNVRKGERALFIWAPMSVRDREHTDENGEPRRITLFKLVPVFDVAQTDGEPLPEPPREPITGDTPGLEILPRLEVFARAELGYKIEYVEAGELGGAGGDCDPSAKRIRVAADKAPNARLRVLLHELAHALGVFYSHTPNVEEAEQFPRDVAEVLVESAAYVAARACGLDTAGETVAYVAGWADGKPERIRAVAAQVDALATRLEAAAGIGGE